MPSILNNRRGVCGFIVLIFIFEDVRVLLLIVNVVKGVVGLSEKLTGGNDGRVGCIWGVYNHWIGTF